MTLAYVRAVQVNAWFLVARGNVIEKKYRTFWLRFWAGNVDALVLSPIFLVDNWLWTQPMPIATRVLWFVLSSLAWPAYSILLHGRGGQTVGKRWLRIKVVDVSGKALTMAQALRRELINLPFAVWSVVTALIVIVRGGFLMIQHTGMAGRSLLSVLAFSDSSSSRPWAAASVARSTIWLPAP